MAIEIPPEALPFFELYGIPWPDIDEDVFKELPQPLRTFGSDVSALGEEIGTTLRELAAGNPSQTLLAITDHFAMVRRDFLDKVSDLCDELAGAPCNGAYDAIVALKLTAIGAVSAQILDTVAEAASEVATAGADTPLVVAAWLAVRETVTELIDAALQQIPSLLIQYATPTIEHFANQLVGGFISSIEHAVEGSVDPYVANLLFTDLTGAESSALLLLDDAARTLHLTPGDLERSISSILGSSAGALTAGSRLEHAAAQLFAHPAPSAPSGGGSSALRVLVGAAVTQVIKDLTGAADQLLRHIINEVVNLLERYMQALQSLDQQAGAQASRQHALPGPAVVVASTVGVAAAVAAGIVATSGAAGAAGGGMVQVGEASLVSETAGVEVAPDPPPVAVEDASVQDVVADLALPAQQKLGTESSAVADGAPVDPLERKPQPVQPHATQAEPSPSSVATLSPRRDGARSPVGDGAPVSPPKNQPDLHLRTHDRREPRVEEVGHPDPAVRAMHETNPAKRGGADAEVNPNIEHPDPAARAAHATTPAEPGVTDPSTAPSEQGKRQDG
jgi:hypothetical protein